MEVHACLWNDVEAFSFSETDLTSLRTALPDINLICHSTVESFLSACSTARIVLTWEFSASWYPMCQNLTHILTPAAGDDWIEPDPANRVEIIHGAFHGDILAESLLSAVLFMNHRMPAMIRNFEGKGWDRNIQTSSRLMRDQHILIVGLGNIGEACARLLKTTGATVTGVRRNTVTASVDTNVISVDRLEEYLPVADHIILLLPGNDSTERLMNPGRLAMCKKDAIIYNFGRGNALYSSDLLDAWDQLGGAFLDVTDIEPLPQNSPLWQLENIMITPHSSCVYQNYKKSFVEEATIHLRELGS